jgi:N-acetylmuramoyl-L-alanine amidase
MKVFRIEILVVLFSFLFVSCSTNRYAKTNKVYTRTVKEMVEVIEEPLPPPTLPSPEVVVTPEVFVAGAEGKRDDLDWVGTVNFNLRKPDFVIIHHTAQDSTEQTLRTFTLTRTQVSAHYVIGRDGKTYQMLNDYLRAWHAGNSRWGKVTDMNSHSIGIELDNNGREPFSTIQIRSLLKLLDTLKSNYNIPQANFIGHSDIAPTRKQDPSVHFPWKTLADNGYGLWYDEFLTDPPEGFDPALALRVIGYDTRNLPAAIVAFKRHYIQSDVSAEWTPLDLQVLYNLFLKQE